MTFTPEFKTGHEQMCFENATEFNTVRGRAGNKIKQTHATFAAALDYADGFEDNRTMIYAVTAEGYGAHICNR